MAKEHKTERVSIVLTPTQKKEMNKIIDKDPEMNHSRFARIAIDEKLERY